MFWRKGFFLFICKVTADGDLVLDSWLGSFVSWSLSCHRWKLDNNLPRLRQRKSPHQNKRVYRFTCTSGFPCWFGRYSFSVSLRSWNDVVRWLFSYLSVLNLCSLVLDRDIAIVKPFKYITFMIIVCYSSDNFLLDTVIYTGCVQGRTSALLWDPSDQYRCSCGLNSMEIFPCVLQVLCFASMLLHVWSARTLAKQLRYHPPSSTLLALIGASAFAFNKYPHKPYIFWKLNSSRLLLISFKKSKY